MDTILPVPPRRVSIRGVPFVREVKGHRGTAMPRTHLTPRGQDYWKRVDRAAHTAWPARDAGDGDEELLRTLLGPLAGTLDASARV